MMMVPEMMIISHIRMAVTQGTTRTMWTQVIPGIVEILGILGTLEIPEIPVILGILGTLETLEIQEIQEILVTLGIPEIPVTLGIPGTLVIQEIQVIRELIRDTVEMERWGLMKLVKKRILWTALLSIMRSISAEQQPVILTVSDGIL